MAGFGDGQIAKDVHDSIFAKAIAIKVDGTEVVFISADMVLIPELVVLKIAENLKGKIDRKQYNKHGNTSQKVSLKLLPAIRK